MLDSSYMNAGDPNSMRDNGATRNCAYIAQIGEPFSKTFSHLRSTSKPDYSGYLIPKSINTQTNNTFYSFGGSKMINNVRFDNEMVAPVLLPNQAVYSQRPCDIIREHNINRVNDYTKNISESIFSPGVLPDQAKEVRLRKSNRSASCLSAPSKAHKKIV